AKTLNPCAAKTLNPCAAKTLNPCAAKTLNPCAAKTLNPCAAKTLNPCAAKTLNPCAAKTLNPCAAKTLNPCAAKTLNPCAAKTLNPCAAKTLNPCAAKTLNPCKAKTLNPCAAKRLNPCQAKALNPCGGKAVTGPMNPCGGNPCGAKTLDASRFRQPAGVRLAGGRRTALVAQGKELWNDRSLGKSGLACASCHIDNYSLMQPTFAKPYPHYVAMPHQQAGVKQVNTAEMVQFCMLVPMLDEPLDWNSKELASLTAYVESIQSGYHSVAGGAANPCNPCSMKRNPCNPCGGR
ncbi:MAG: hypothetical protein E2O73_03760, partial [Deltaproteobacteria bacterium]